MYNIGDHVSKKDLGGGPLLFGWNMGTMGKFDQSAVELLSQNVIKK